jgi:hypothetical protein
MTTENQEPKKSDPEDDKSDDSSRSPGVTDRKLSAATNVSTDSPGVTDRQPHVEKKKSPEN